MRQCANSSSACTRNFPSFRCDLFRRWPKVATNWTTSARARFKADKELIKQFRFMSRLFESCRERLQRSRSDSEARQLLLALGRACLEEHAEWILLHRERPLDNA